MATDAQNVFTEIDATGIDEDSLTLPISDDEEVEVEKQVLSADTVEKVEDYDSTLAEGALLDSREQGDSRVQDGETVEVAGRRLLVDSERVGYAVVWQDLTLDEDGTVSKEVGYVVTDPTAIR